VLVWGGTAPTTAEVLLSDNFVYILNVRTMHWSRPIVQDSKETLDAHIAVGRAPFELHFECGTRSSRMPPTSCDQKHASDTAGHRRRALMHTQLGCSRRRPIPPYPCPDKPSDPPPSPKSV
jgi:hypothetical protein